MSHKSIKISHPELLKIKDVATKGKYRIQGGILEGFTDESENNDNSVIIMNFQEEVSFNSIQFSISENEKKHSPNLFRFEITSDGIVWEPIIQEIDFRKNVKNHSFLSGAANPSPIICWKTNLNSLSRCRINFLPVSVG